MQALPDRIINERESPSVVNPAPLVLLDVFSMTDPSWVCRKPFALICLSGSSVCSVHHEKGRRKNSSFGGWVKHLHCLLRLRGGLEPRHHGVDKASLLSFDCLGALYPSGVSCSSLGSSCLLGAPCADEFHQFFARVHTELRIEMFDVCAHGAHSYKQLFGYCCGTFTLHAHEQHFSFALSETAFVYQPFAKASQSFALAERFFVSNGKPP